MQEIEAILRNQPAIWSFERLGQIENQINQQNKLQTAKPLQI
jgi:hypothetical protein